MQKKTIQFSKFQIFYMKDEKNPETFEIRKEIFNDFDRDFSSNKGDSTAYRVVSDFNDSYAFFSIEFGNSEPWATTVTDVKTKKKRANPRKADEAELRNQIFAYYSFNEQMLYFSNQLKKRFFANILENQLHYKFVIKEIYGDVDSFIESIDTVKEVRFTSTDDLFSNNQEQRLALETLTGTLAPTRLTIKTEYRGSKYYIKNIAHWIRNLNKSQKNEALKNLVVKGDDANGFEQIFNTENLISKVGIQVNKNEHGIVNRLEVLSAIKSEIEKNYV
ncbi:hypothetical protein EFN12_08540 [Pediococcus pentosaceus]|uniref:hypothetical protein n=1 Tax=Pediococcus pentosaceus TaxID=1255 RepID=UPI0021A4502A|nr:hypothetical protein [Pediococcus pentosaceus]MCT3024634.1 hypothetical protein [Pediococcus pentosaceus]